MESNILIELDITGLDLTDATSPAAQEWNRLVEVLNSTVPNTLCGCNEDDPNQVLLIFRKYTRY